MNCCCLERWGIHGHHEGELGEVVTDKQVILIVPAKEIGTYFVRGLVALCGLSRELGWFGLDAYSAVCR